MYCGQREHNDWVMYCTVGKENIMIGSCIVLWAREHNDWVMYCTVGKENIMIGSCIVLWAKRT